MMMSTINRSTTIRWAAMIVFSLAALPHVAAADNGDAKVLNNLVSELFNLEAAQTEAHKQYTFTNPRPGWVFFSTAASVNGTQRALVTLDTATAKTPIAVHSDGKMTVHEAMRHLPAGEHTISVQCQGGAVLHGLVVRAIPEIIYPGLGYWTRQAMSKQAPYNWSYLKRIGIAKNINVILERNFDAALDAAQWRKQGKKIYTRASTHTLIRLRKESGQPFTAEWAYQYLANTSGFKRSDRDGIMISEFDGYGSQKQEYPDLAEAVRRLYQNPQYQHKTLIPYTVVVYRDEGGVAFLRELIKAGSKIAEERYIAEQPTEAKAKELLAGGIGYVMKKYQEKIPDFQQHMVWNLGYMSAPPESLNTNPAVNYKVFMEMQFNYIANDPAFAGLYGLMWYHSAYADEETLRWSARLFRHYCIEGKRQMLGTDPYILPHIDNPDFGDDATGWKLAPAETGSMAVKHAEGFGRRQARYTGQSPAIENQGDYFMWTKRSAERPNSFSQPIKALKAGKLYSLKMITADYRELSNEKSSKAVHQVGVQIDNAVMLPPKSFQHVYGSDKLWLTYHVFVFRATSNTATLTISDWVSSDPVYWPSAWGLQFNIEQWKQPGKPGGPIGQELMFNFIELQPYLEN
jgi:hypothetical protein